MLLLRWSISANYRWRAMPTDLYYYAIQTISIHHRIARRRMSGVRQWLWAGPALYYLFVSNICQTRINVLTSTCTVSLLIKGSRKVAACSKKDDCSLTSLQYLQSKYDDLSPPPPLHIHPPANRKRILWQQLLQQHCSLELRRLTIRVSFLYSVHKICLFLVRIPPDSWCAKSFWCHFTTI